MSEIVITRKSNTTYDIEGMHGLKERNLTKLNIFLSSLKNSTLVRSEGKISVVFSTDSDSDVSGNLRSLVDYLIRISCEVVLDPQIALSLKKEDEQRKDSLETVERLRQVKKGLYVDKEFLDFCQSCNDRLRITLRDYQYKAAYLMTIGKGGFDFSVPGSGKTIITYAAYIHLKEQSVINRLFVIGPINSYNAWFDEYVTCFGKKPEFENLTESSVQDCKLYLKASSEYQKEITFINIDKIRMLKDEIIAFLANETTLLVIDEAHKIKNPSAAATQSALQIVRYAKSRVLLTGTPMPNGYEDLYSLSHALLPSYDILPHNYSQLKAMTKNNATPQQTKRIRECLYPYYSRISKKYLLSIGELQNPNFNSLHCEMDDYQRALYDKLNTFCGKINEHIDQDILESLKKAILIRKMQISANPGLLKGSLVNSMDELRDQYTDSTEREYSDINMLMKADKQLMGSIIDSEILSIVSKYYGGAMFTPKNIAAVRTACSLVAEGKKVLIWDIFVKNMETLWHMVESKLGHTVEIVNGSVTGQDRQLALSRFREGSSMVLVANPATLAESISLHKACQNAIYVNRNFNAAQFIQSKDRIHRINMPLGTTANYYFFSNRNSIDLIVNDRLNKKEQRMLAILDADDIEIGGSEMEDSTIMSSQDIEEGYWR